MENKSENRAREIISIHLSRLEKELSNEVLSVILVGSLSNGSYTGNAGSDIDLIHILKDEASDDVRNKVRDIIEKTDLLTSYDLPIAKCIYRIGEMKRPFRNDFELSLENKDLIELPIEILRIKDSGITILGQDVVDSIDTPKREDIIYSKELSNRRNKEEREKFPERFIEYDKNIQNPSSRIVVQSVIVNAMMDYYFITGKSCSSKKEIGKLMRQHVKNYIFQELLDLCITYRYTPEEITLNQEKGMHEQYNLWCEIRKGKEIGDIQHLIAIEANNINGV
ncbi:nucleotidyltransferase domain-containing protein [Tissierella sp.]|uniref:nucleotidyltransferase domain-containing protein n=1 Tax=Tissierella sp. TaxID=41274 RepID=UPI0028605935|nr:nucleotidyltransferase domain-containing protein [Tissierella sp.]MDR7856771.1 nucleotidyltransferase domain-containing protein [Tissierella sp.]